jgi:tetratricopeptide (TPR) repeat protein
MPTSVPISRSEPRPSGSGPAENRNASTLLVGQALSPANRARRGSLGCGSAAPWRRPPAVRRRCLLAFFFLASLLHAQTAADWQRALKADSRNVQALVNLGILSAQEKHFREAEAFYERALRLKPGDPQILLNLGLAHFKDGDLKGAIPALEHVVKAEPTNEQARTLLAMSFYGAGEFPRAARLLTELPAAHTNPSLQQMLAQSYIWAGELDKAAVEVESLLRDNPNSAPARILLGEALDGMGRPDEALLQFQLAVGANPSEPNVHFGLGFLYWRKKDIEQAEPEFRAELALDPAHSQAMAYLGDIEMQHGNFTQAELLLAKSVSSRANIRLAHYDLGILLQNQEDHKHAIQEFQTAIRLAPNRADAHYRLAASFRALDRNDEATAELRIVRSLHEDKKEEALDSISRPQAQESAQLPRAGN